MAYRDTPLVPGEYFHIYNRGNSKQNIFITHGDYVRFQHSLFIANGTNHFSFRTAKRQEIFDFDRGQTLVNIEAYCLMPNHFHILLKSDQEGGIQKFMQKLATGYSMYFNIKNQRTGGLFEGKYKSKYVNSDQYLKYMYSYIHLNPLKLFQSDWREQGVREIELSKQFLIHYPYYSLVDRIGDVKRPEEKILSSDPPLYFTSRQEWMEELLQWLALEEVLLPQ